MKIKITGINCEACTKIIKKRLLTVPGVIDAQINLDGNTNITTKQEVTLLQLQEVLHDTEYRITN